jgi:F-type H+-transporting ATPase subunit gamma
MATAKEIRNKIKSIQNTQKITRAMEMVATSKMRKAQSLMLAARPYSEKIRTIISHLACAHAEYHHPYLTQRLVNRIGLIVISTDRGLCGGLNLYLFREVLRAMRDWQNQGVEIDFCTIGNKANAFFRRLRGNILAHASRLGDSPSPQTLIGIVKVMLDVYTKGQIDRLFLAHNVFVNKMNQKPRLLQLIPALADAKEADAKEGICRYYWDYLYEPDAKELLNLLFDRYLVSVIYQAVVENIACEMAARMIAMKSASDNANELINQLRLNYNKARQATITQELAEIVGGAAAV